MIFDPDIPVDGSKKTVSAAARRFTAYARAELDAIEREANLFALVARAAPELADTARPTLLREWLDLRGTYEDAWIIRGEGSARPGARMAGGRPLADPTRRAVLGSGIPTKAGGRAPQDGRLFVVAPIDDAPGTDRLVVQVGEAWLAAVAERVRASFDLDRSRLRFSVRDGAGHVLLDEPSGVETQAANTASAPLSQDTHDPGWTVTAKAAEGGIGQLGLALALVGSAGLFGYRLGGSLSRRLGALARRVQGDDDPPHSRIVEFEDVRAACLARGRHLQRAAEDAAASLARTRGRLAACEDLSGWTCWEVEPETGRIVRSDLDGVGDESGMGADHALDLHNLIEGIEPEDHSLLWATMGSALQDDEPHEVALRPCGGAPDPRRLLIRFRRGAPGSDACEGRLFALSRKVAEPHAGAFSDPAGGDEPRRDPALDRIVDGLVHDMTDALTIVTARLDPLVRRCERDGRPVDALRPDGAHGRRASAGPIDPDSWSGSMGPEIRAALVGAERGAALARHMLATLRARTRDLAETDLEDLVAAALPFLQEKVLGDLPVMNRLPPDLPLVACSERVVETALLNLAFHVREAGLQGFALAARYDGQADCVRLAVTSGPPRIGRGRLADGDRPHLRAVADLLEGVGAGLSVLADGHGAEPFLAELRLPAAPCRRQGPRHAARALRILLVVPDALLRASVAALLADLGHGVVEAATGLQALDALSAAEGFDAMLADGSLPVMTGLRLATTVAQRHPGVGVVLMSPRGTLPAEADRFPRLDKPLRRAQIEGVLAALDGPAAEQAA